MIIIGYPCIGKTTLAAKVNNIIDLESSNFSKSNKLWWKDYCKVAEDLSKQGFIVFVSCHREVQDGLANSEEIVWAMYPMPLDDLYDIWESKAWERYSKSGLEKDLLAYKRIKEEFFDDIYKIGSNTNIKNRVLIDHGDYDLFGTINKLKKEDSNIVFAI